MSHPHLSLNFFMSLLIIVIDFFIYIHKYFLIYLINFCINFLTCISTFLYKIYIEKSTYLNFFAS